MTKTNLTKKYLHYACNNCLLQVTREDIQRIVMIKIFGLDRVPTFQARSQIRSQVIAKSPGSGQPVFTSMGALTLWAVALRWVTFNGKRGCDH
jgi:hypothetical protein